MNKLDVKSFNYGTNYLRNISNVQFKYYSSAAHGFTKDFLITFTFYGLWITAEPGLELKVSSYFCSPPWVVCAV